VRLFAAVETSRETRHAMAAEQKRIAASLGPSGASLRWVRPDGTHLTLVFLGEVDAAGAQRLVKAMAHDVDAAPFDIAFGGAGVFPSRGAPRVLWVGVGDGVNELTALRREMAARIAAHGVVIEARGFHPHLTLGRWTSSRPSDRARALAAVRPSTLARQLVTRVTLYESRLSSSGAAYTALAHANLARA
jgi:RNA 2',3'-cyclic 3'-phosphodiesterase